MVMDYERKYKYFFLLWWLSSFKISLILNHQKNPFPSFFWTFFPLPFLFVPLIVGGRVEEGELFSIMVRTHPPLPFSHSPKQIPHMLVVQFNCLQNWWDNSTQDCFHLNLLHCQLLEAENDLNGTHTLKILFQIHVYILFTLSIVGGRV